jgi:alkylation response protein AidB-like acyl-CoA dehydrogenase
VARTLADELLFPAAGQVDAAHRIPVGHFEALADAGLYGVATRTDANSFHAITEALASGCLATAFVWIQHHGLVRRLASPASPVAPSARWLGDLESGRVRAGIIQAGLLPGSPVLRAEPVDGGWRLHGRSPWFTGWGIVDVALLAARHHADPDCVVWLVIDAVEQQGLTVEPLLLAAVDATRTVALRFDGVAVGADRFLGTDSLEEVGHAAGRGLRANGSLALGLVDRCNRLEPTRGRFDHRLADARAQLDAADDADLPTARAAAALLAVDAATALIVASGAGAAIEGSTAERFVREAAFLLVFGSRPSIKSALLDRLGDDQARPAGHRI